MVKKVRELVEYDRRETEETISVRGGRFPRRGSPVKDGGEVQSRTDRDGGLSERNRGANPLHRIRDEGFLELVGRTVR